MEAEAPSPGILLNMDIEQLPPKRPNFTLIVVLFAVTLLVLLACGVWFLHVRAGHTLPDGRSSIGVQRSIPQRGKHPLRLQRLSRGADFFEGVS